MKTRDEMIAAAAEERDLQLNVWAGTFDCLSRMERLLLIQGAKWADAHVLDHPAVIDLVRAAERVQKVYGENSNDIQKGLYIALEKYRAALKGAGNG